MYVGGQDTHAEVDETGTQLTARARIAQNKAVRAGVVSVLTNKAASKSFSSQGSGQDLKTPKKEVEVKKEKKEKSPEEVKQKEFMTDCSKFLNCLNLTNWSSYTFTIFHMFSTCPLCVLVFDNNIYIYSSLSEDLCVGQQSTSCGYEDHINRHSTPRSDEGSTWSEVQWIAKGFGRVLALLI